VFSTIARLGSLPSWGEGGQRIYLKNEEPIKGSQGGGGGGTTPKVTS